MLYRYTYCMYYIGKYAERARNLRSRPTRARVRDTYRTRVRVRIPRAATAPGSLAAELPGALRAAFIRIRYTVACTLVVYTRGQCAAIRTSRSSSVPPSSPCLSRAYSLPTCVCTCVHARAQ